MSSYDQATSETTRLLGGDARPVTRERSKFSPETLLIPIVLATRISTLLPTTTLIEVVRQMVCSNMSSSSLLTAADGPSSLELCDTPEVERTFSTVVAIMGAVQGVMFMAACAVLSRIASRRGRKPAFLFLLGFGIVGNCVIPLSQYFPGWLKNCVFVVGVLSQMFSGALPYSYLDSTYIVDVCPPTDRTAALSKIGGWGMLGVCISAALGGSITTATGNSVIVFYMAAAIFALTFVYIVTVLPESFTEEKRKALAQIRSESSMHSTGLLGWLSRIFGPLRLLVPTHAPGGTRSWRLGWCAAHFFFFAVSDTYLPTAWVVFVTAKYHLTPAETGIFLSASAASGGIFLAVAVPSLVRFLRPYYVRRPASSALADEVFGNSQPSEPQISDRLDVHIAVVACVIAGIAYLCAAANITIPGMIFSAILAGLVLMHNPTSRSLVAASVDPLKQGEALAAVEIVNSAGALLSPLVMGGILTATIDTAPLLLFYVHLIMVLVSAGLLFFVRDEDRYQRSNET